MRVTISCRCALSHLGRCFWFLVGFFNRLLHYHRLHSISFDRFFWLWSFLHAVFIQTVCASFAASTIKVQNVRDNGHPWTSRFVAAEHSWPPFNWLQDLAGNWATSLPDVTDLMHRLIDTCSKTAGVKRSVIDDAIDLWRRRLDAFIRDTWGYLNIHCDIN